MSAVRKAAFKKHVVQRPFALSCLMGTGVGMLALFCLILLFSAVASGCRDPGPLLTPMAVCSLYLGALFAGGGAVRFTGDGLVAGGIGGVFYTAAVFLLSLLPLPPSELPPSVGLILLVLLLPASVLGAILGHRKAKRPRSRR